MYTPDYISIFSDPPRFCTPATAPLTAHRSDADGPQNPNAAGYRYGGWGRGAWYEHQNMRDERAEAFASLLWAGVYHYSYVARATTPGTFVAPPAKAEEMYAPEVFGRSSSDWVIVE